MANARRWIVVLLAALVASVGARRPASLFDEYQAHDYVRFDADLKATTDFSSLSKEAIASSSSWPPDVAAAYLLEVSAAAMHAQLFPRLPDPNSSASYSGGPLRTSQGRDWNALFALSEHNAMRMPGDSRAARTWGRAALALLSGAFEVSPLQAASETIGTFEEFAKSMRAYADDQTISMARGYTHEALIATALSYNLPAAIGDPKSKDPTHEVASFYPAVQGTLVRSFNEGMKAFLAGMSYPDTRAEAAVRVAGLALVRNLPGDPDFALSHLTLAREWSPDPDVLYVSWVLEGQAERALGKTTAASQAFSRAMTLTPNGSAARLSLAVQAFLAGDNNTANDLAQQILGMPAGADDPWVLFQHGDYRHWAQRVDALRKSIQ